MAYTKNTWVDQDVERPKTYEVTNNQDGSITLTDSFGLVTELGTPVNATNMNHIEDGIEDLDLLKTNIDLSNLSNAGEKHFLNKTQITNCILEAPNGVMEVAPDGYNITLKQGLKVLMPDGRNADGTLKNIEFTLNSDVSSTALSSTSTYQYFIFLTSGGSIKAIDRYYEGIDSKKPTVSASADIVAFYYSTDTNETYISQSNSTTFNWVKISCACVGISNLKNSLSTIDLYPYSPITITGKDDSDNNLILFETDTLLFSTKTASNNTYEVDVSNILPDDGNFYMLYGHYYISRTDASNSNTFFAISEFITSSHKYWVQDNVQGGTSSTDQVSTGSFFCVPVGFKRKIGVRIGAVSLSGCEVRIMGYKKINKISKLALS